MPSADLDLCARCGNQFSWPQVCGNCRHKRPSWDEYFLSIARVVASRSDCVRRQAGAVVVRDRRIVATGYNGAPAGKPGCSELPCPRSRSDVAPGSSYDTGAGSCIAIHAEANALVYADYDKCAGATMYVTCEPCDGCLRLIDAAGIALTTWRGKDA